MSLKGHARTTILAGVLVSSCATLPSPSHRPYAFPNGAFYLPPKDREYEVIGTVKSKVNFNALDQEHSEETLCANYYNKSVDQLLREARKKGADAVIDVRSVVLLMDGRVESYPRAECSDDGEEGQVLTEAIAVRWKKPATARGAGNSGGG